MSFNDIMTRRIAAVYAENLAKDGEHFVRTVMALRRVFDLSLPEAKAMVAKAFEKVGRK